MSDDPIDETPQHDSSRSQDNDHRLDAIIHNLNSKIATFEQNLESAVLSETHFRTNIQTLLNSLDTFVETHVEKDRHLTQLIEEDTQRSKEAKEEYDALASRFDDNLRKDNITRTTKWLTTASVYIGIVVSLVLMAPFHALWWLFTRALRRTGILKSSHETTVFSTARKRRRAVSQKTTSSTRPVTAARHRRRASANGGVSSNAGPSPVAPTSIAKKAQETVNHVNRPDAPHPESANNLMDQAHADNTHPRGNVNHGEDSTEILLTDMPETGSQTRRVETHKTDSSDSGEEYFDAKNDCEARSPHISEIVAAQDEQIEREDDGGGTTRESTRPRPGWAVPAGSDETLPDMDAFPSSDFWDISDDDLRLEVQQQDQASS